VDALPFVTQVLQPTPKHQLQIIH